MSCPVPLSLAHRELGFIGSSHSYSRFDMKTPLTKLSYVQKDQYSMYQLMINSTEFPDDYLRPHVNPVYSMEFSPFNKSILAASDEIGCVALIDTRSSRRKVLKYTRCHSNALYKVSWSPFNPNLLATAGSDQSARVWDINTFTPVTKCLGHTRTVRTVKFNPWNKDMMATCGRDGTIKFWDLRCKKNLCDVENEIANAHSLHVPHKPGSHTKARDTILPVTDIVFRDENTLISCGATEGNIKFWDLRKSYKYLKTKEPIRTIKFPLKSACQGYSSMVLDEMGNLYASTAGSDILKFNLASETPDTPVMTFYRGLVADYSVTVDVSFDGRFLISGSMSSFAYIWDTWHTSSQHPFVKLEGAVSERCLSHGIFSQTDPCTVITGGDDSLITVWRVDPLYDRSKNKGVNYSREESDLLPHDDDGVLLAPLELPKPEFEYNLPKTQHPKFNSKTITSTDRPDHQIVTTFLRDLPNYVINGELPHVPPNKLKKKSSFQRTLSFWLNGKLITKGANANPEPLLSESESETSVKRPCSPDLNSNEGTPTKRRKMKGLKESNSGSPQNGSKARTPVSTKSRQGTQKSRSGRVRDPSIRENLSPALGPSTANSTPTILRYFAPITTQLGLDLED